MNKFMSAGVNLKKRDSKECAITGKIVRFYRTMGTWGETMPKPLLKILGNNSFRRHKENHLCCCGSDPGSKLDKAKSLALKYQ
jgi:hypothetical protein